MLRFTILLFLLSALTYKSSTAQTLVELSRPPCIDLGLKLIRPLPDEKRDSILQIVCDDCEERFEGICDYAAIAGAPLTYLSTGKLEEARTAVDKVISQPFCQKKIGRLALANAQNAKGGILRYKAEIDSAIQTFHKSLNNFQIENDSIGMVRSMMNLGTTYQTTGRVDSMTYYLSISNQIANKIQDKYLIASSGVALCTALANHGKSSTILKTCTEARKLAEKHSPRHVGILYSTIGTYFKELKIIDSAQFYLTKSLNHPSSSPYTKYNCHFNLADQFTTQEKYSLGKTHIDSALLIANSLQLPEEIASANSILAKIYQNEGKHRQAANILSKVIQFIDTTEIEQTIELRAYENYIFNLSKIGIPVKPKYIQLISAIHDTIRAQTGRNAIATLSAQYNDEKRVMEIKTLEADRQVQIGIVDNRNKILIISGIGILSLLVGLFFTLRLRKRALIGEAREKELNKNLQQKTEEVTTLNRELNHRAANQLSLAYELILDQRRQIGDEQAKASLQKSESQLMALREVNRALANKSDDLVQADQVLQKVAENLQAASPHPFKLDLQLNAITIHGNAASRSALILSELMSNSIKYAFPNQEDAKATLSLQQSDRGISMTYVDNGPGKDGRTRGTGVGSELIEAMLEDMDAEFEEIAGEDGTGYGMRWWWG